MIIEGYKIPLVKSTEYQRHWSNRHPYPHQARVFAEWEREENFFITTRTGSGKTATAAFPVFVHEESAIFVYPTNALLEDQVQSLCSIANGIGKRVHVLDGQVVLDSDEEFDADHLIVVLNSASLDHWKKKLCKRTKGEVMHHLLSKRVPMIILTNPDVLFLLASMRYSGSAKSIAFMGRFSTLVVDEFHLYSGMELAHLLFLLFYLKKLSVYKRVLFLSATPSEETKGFVDAIYQPLWITEDAVGSQVVGERDVVHSLSLRPVATDDVVRDMINEVKKLVAKLKEMPLSSEDHPVPLVIIVNSVVQAMRLEEELEKFFKIDEIASYRGLINPLYRSFVGKRIVVGTQAIEVGVDFDCSMLFFEARDASSFLQRIGRAGRHRPGEVMLFCDSRVQQSLESKPASIGRSELEEWVRYAYRYQEDMSWFVGSKEGLWSAYTLIQNSIRQIEDVAFATQEQKDNAMKALLEFYSEYLNCFGDLISVETRNIVKTIYSNRARNRKDSWQALLLEANAFRPGSFSLEVFSIREKMLGRDQEAGYFQAELKRVLEQGKGVSIQRGSNRKKGIVIATVKNFGKRCRSSVMGLPRRERNELDVLPTDQLSFESEAVHFGGNLLSSDQVIYYKAPRQMFANPVDWRIETWSVSGSDEIAAFGGHALLLKAWCDHVQASSKVKGSPESDV